MAETSPLVVLIGHCGPDGHMLRNAVLRAVPNARVQMADDPESVEIAAPAAHLLLINRVLEGGLGTGVELIRKLRSVTSAPMMLVSNYPDAQQEAEAAGALPGFGKRDVNAEETTRRIRAAVQSALAADNPAA